MASTISTSLPSKRISTPAAALLSSPTSTNPAKTKVVNILKEWESLSQLSLPEEQILEQLQQQHSSRPFYINKQNSHPLHLTTPSTPRTPSASSTTTPSLSYRQELVSFYRDLYSKEFSAENEDEQEQFIGSQMNQLNTYKRICDDMIEKVNTTLGLCENLKEQYTNVSNKTVTLHKDCEKLVQEKEQLSKICNGIESRLNFFNEFEQFASELNAGAINLHSADFASNLKLLDESIQFLLRNPSYKEARVYLTKYKQLFARAQGHMRDYIVNSLSKATKSMQVKTPETPSSYAQELSSLYIQYRTSIENLKPLIKEIELRSYIKEYSVYLSDCFDCYLEQRRILMYPLIEKRIQALASESNMTSFVREGSQYMLSVCSEEEQLFKHFFSSESLFPRLRMLIESFCSLLYEGLRAMVLSQNNIDVLCDLVAILQNEFLRTKAKNLKAFETVMHRMIQDIQERLIFRASTYISDNLRSYKPKPEDLNYPGKLLEKQKSTTTTEAQSPETSTPSSKFDDYYPTLEITLTFLSKLYQSLDVEVFESFAHTAVSLCTNSFIEASKKISEKKGIMDGELFLIKHLLTFREQLSAFNVSFASTETSLDFSSLSQGFSKFLRGQTTLSVSGIIFDIMSQSRPKIVHKHVDSKKDLEKLIFVTVRESFILNVTRIIFDPIIAFLKKVSSQQKTSGEHPAASAEEVLQLYQSCLQNMEQVLTADLKPKLSLYLPNPATREELYKGVRQSLANVYQEFYSLAQEMGSEVQNHILSPQAFLSKLE